jgi:hypothetical protein
MNGAPRVVIVMCSEKAKPVVTSSRAIISADDLPRVVFMRRQVFRSMKDPKIEKAATRIWEPPTG